ncbi:MAG: hypothetical protein RQM92_09155 [Candidatus Syntrophopropionicum ammoniitolerans]
MIRMIVGHHNPLNVLYRNIKGRQPILKAAQGFRRFRPDLSGSEAGF